MYDVAIIGTGAAGVSAALTLKALGKDMIWFGNPKLSEKIAKAEKIRNYPGLPMVSGENMQAAFLAQIEEMGITITEKKVTGVYKMGNYYSVLCNQDMFDAKTVILTTGVEAVKPLPGELEFVGRGVSYCAVCDGFLYKDRTIAVLCTSKSLENEIEYLADFAAKVYLIPLYKDVDVKKENVEIVKGMLTQIKGSKRAEYVVFNGKELAVDGVFMLKAAVSPSVLVPGLKTSDGHIDVDRNQKTNFEGCYAAGDCTGRPYQYAKAVGEGNVAAHSVNEYLNSIKQEK